jgi:hypothetical protein
MWSLLNDQHPKKIPTPSPPIIQGKSPPHSAERQKLAGGEGMTPEEYANQVLEASYTNLQADFRNKVIEAFRQAIAEERENAREAAAMVMRSLVLPHKHKQLPTAEEFITALDKILAEV